MARNRRWAAALVVVLASIGCGGGGGDASVRAPTGLTIAHGASFDDVILEWTPPSEAIDGYVVEVSVGGSPFQEIVREPAPADTIGVIITVDPDVPELVTLAFRVRAYRGAIDSVPTDVVSIQRGIRRPELELPIEIGTGPDGNASGPVVLRWTARSAIADVVQVERAPFDPMAGNGPFTPLAVAFPATSLADSATTPGTAYTYRVRHGRGGTFSEWAWGSTPALDWPIHAPTGLAAAPALSGATRVDPVTVTWTNASAMADALELSRAEVLAGGALGPWTVLPAAFPATRWVDADVQDPKAYAYRLRYSKGTLQSAPVEVRAEPVDLLRPRDLSVTRTESGYHLAWTNRSHTATEIRVGWTTLGSSPEWPPPGPPVLAATDASWDDARGIAWPGTRYTVAAARGPYLVTSEPAEIPAPEVAAPVALRGGVVNLPAGLTAARDSRLRFHVVASSGDALLRPTDGAWETHALPGPYTVSAIELDGLDHPHAIHRTMAEVAAGRQWTLTHVWHDGAAWQTEVAAEVIQPPLFIEAEMLGVDAAGVVHVFYDTDGGSLYSYVHAVREPAGWAATPVEIDPTVVPDPFPLRVGADVAPDGTAYLAYLVIEGANTPEWVTRVVLVTRTPGGAWTQEVAPTGETSSAGGLATVAFDGGLGLVYPRGEEYWYVEKRDGAWGTPERVATRGADERMKLAVRSADGRVHAVLQGVVPGVAEHAQVCARGAGAWTCTPFAPWPMYGALATGHRPDGKAWVLAFPGPATGVAPAALYEEP